MVNFAHWTGFWGAEWDGWLKWNPAVLIWDGRLERSFCPFGLARKNSSRAATIGQVVGLMTDNVLQTLQQLIQDVIAPDVRELKVRVTSLEKQMDVRFDAVDVRFGALEQK